MISADPILYSFRRCPYAMRARLALAASGTRYELREVKLSAKPEAMLAASPKGTVPVLALPDGEVIDQSINIMRWALARNDPDGWLEGDDEALTRVRADRHRLAGRRVALCLDRKLVAARRHEVVPGAEQPAQALDGLRADAPALPAGVDQESEEQAEADQAQADQVELALIERRQTEGRRRTARAGGGLLLGLLLRGRHLAPTASTYGALPLPDAHEQLKRRAVSPR